MDEVLNSRPLKVHKKGKIKLCELKPISQGCKCVNAHQVFALLGRADKAPEMLKQLYAFMAAN